jgi:hypothetical protein
VLRRKAAQCVVHCGGRHERLDRVTAPPPAPSPRNIDRLAERGVNFTNAHTAGVFCAPSRAAIFSGQFASTTGCYDTALYFRRPPRDTSASRQLPGGRLPHHGHRQAIPPSRRGRRPARMGRVPRAHPAATRDRVPDGLVVGRDSLPQPEAIWHLSSHPGSPPK